MHAADAEFDRRDAAVVGRPIVLHARRHADRPAPRCSSRAQQLLGGPMRRPSTPPARPPPRRSSPTTRRCRRRPANPIACGRPRRRAPKCGRAARAAAGGRLSRSSAGGRFDLLAACPPTRCDDAASAPRRRSQLRPEADRGIDRLRAVVKQVERPDVERAAGRSMRVGAEAVDVAPGAL